MSDFRVNFPARGNKPPVRVKWYEGPSVPEAPAGYDGPMGGEGGMIMIGENGGICHGGMRPDSPQLHPKQKWEEYRASPEKRVPKTLPRVKGIHRDWIESVRNGTPAC